MKENQKGFSAVEGLLLILAVVLIAAAGWFVWQNQNNKPAKVASNQVPNSKPEKTAFTDCHTEVDKTEWTTIEHGKVVLSDWDVALTLPDEMIGKGVCRYTSNGYEFSTKAVINDDKCVAYYRTLELVSEGVGVSKYPGSTAAEGQVSGASGTLEDYYTAHKAAGGNYFTDPGAGRNYYKVGDNFYVAFGDATGVLDKYKAGRTAACKDEKPDFAQPFVDALASLKTQ
jgi:flagellin-like protein